MNRSTPYSYAQSVKSDVSDELINTYVLRPVAGILVRALYATPVTPNQVTLAGIACGVGSAVLYAGGSPLSTLLAGLCLTVKDLLDSADGQLARAKQMYSRTGRFLDSIGDFGVNLLVFSAIGYALFTRTGDPVVMFLAALSFLGTTLRVSYHVFYHTSFLHLQESYTLNRVLEEMREEDYEAETLTFRLHQIFLVLYGWQDRLMARVDRWTKHNLPATREHTRRWYGDTTALRFSGFLGLGTELMLLTVCSVLDRLETYLLLNVFLMNGVWLVSMVYRRYVLAERLCGSSR